MKTIIFGVVLTGIVFILKKVDDFLKKSKLNEGN